ncbi:UDP-N-acetylmuramoylalanine--D-glutamate ligase [Helicobacter aurati]|uniref:UDP-N-acetylmuramoylalanine--D-glutamate ligase n=1 Tax=Helicobacter aurati TaxID=137778 RepID=A0A3D8J8J8_9HELI|nr:Mur ligase family protein [Helicobacter aurati]RDU73823.1 UDP-N-acetylmuramoylalanine--D-glutamate ligase [Helicobacter aurati]
METIYTHRENSIVNILGYGITTQALVKLLNYYNVTCHIYDDKFTRDTCALDSMNHYYPLHDVTLQVERISYISIISPGISPQTACLALFKNIISEYDFIYFLLQNGAMTDAPYTVWVSGTNGKTTTTEMTALMLKARAGGNIGIPLTELLDYQHTTNVFHSALSLLMEYAKHNNEYVLPQSLLYKRVPKIDKMIWVLETSSFSLHWTHFALPNLYILLPLSQDHISWHGSYENYIKDKLKVLMLMNKTEHPKSYFALIPQELCQLPFATEIIASCKANIFLYQDSLHLCEYFGITRDYRELFREPFRLDFAVSLGGIRFAQLPCDVARIKEYQIGEYRMQEKVHNGILFINDSKGTNPHATLAALESYKNHTLYLILGGDSKGAQLEMLYPHIKQHNIEVFSIGKDGQYIASTCREYGIIVCFCGTLQRAMQAIFTRIRQRHCDPSPENPLAVMLSPACASTDQYLSYKYRGEEFAQLIEEVFKESPL